MNFEASRTSLYKTGELQASTYTGKWWTSMLRAGFEPAIPG